MMTRPPPCLTRPGRWLACGLATALTTTLATTLVGATSPDARDDAGRGVQDQFLAQRLVRRLGSGSLADRDAAERGLLDFGAGILPLVAAARRHATGEAAHRLAGIQRHLERRADAEAIEPALVTIDVDDTPARDVLETLFTQTGNRIDLRATADRKISARYRRLTFWEALDDVLERSGLALTFVALPAAEGPPAALPLRITDAVPGTAAAPAVAAGPLRVSIAAIERTRRAGADAEVGQARGARVSLRVAWEPRLEPLLVRLPARSVVAEGPGGESMPVAHRSAVIEATIPPRRSWIDLPIVLAPPAAPLDRLGMLRGTVVLWLRGLEHDFWFEDLAAAGDSQPAAAARVLRVGQAEVRLSAVGSEAGRLRFRAAVTYETASEVLSSHHSWLAAYELEARTADGVELAPLGQTVESRSDRGISVVADFARPQPTVRETVDAGPRVTVRWQLPIAIHELPVDFALRDLPLPELEDR